MVHTIEVKAQQDFWKRFVSSAPHRALAEIVWNAFDADSDDIKISVAENGIGSVSEVIVSDNGEGIPFSSEDHLFSQLGNSWKLRANKSRLKSRLLQGQKGEGRFRALALGELVKW